MAGSRALLSRMSLVKELSIWSIAGMTMARFGVSREKKRVASLNTWWWAKAGEDGDSGGRQRERDVPGGRGDEQEGWGNGERAEGRGQRVGRGHGCQSQVMEWKQIEFEL